MTTTAIIYKRAYYLSSSALNGNRYTRTLNSYDRAIDDAGCGSGDGGGKGFRSG